VYCILLLQGWAPLLNSAMSVVGPGEQPARDTSAIYSLPIVLFQIVNVVVIWQLVVAVIVKSLRLDSLPLVYGLWFRV
jgi:hypothetical protein